MAAPKLRIAKKLHLNPHTRTRGYIPQVVTAGIASYEDLVSAACRNTTVNKAEAKASLELCMEAAAEMLSNGHIVDLGPLGRIYPSCTGAWTEKAENLKLDDVRATVHYRPSKGLVESIRSTSLQWFRETAGDKDETAGRTT